VAHLASILVLGAPGLVVPDGTLVRQRLVVRAGARKLIGGPVNFDVHAV